MNPHIYLFLSILLVTGSQFLFKMGVNNLATRSTDTKKTLQDYIMMLFEKNIFLGFALNGMAAVAWLLALSHLELSYVFPFLSLNYILIPIGAHFLFKEKLSLNKSIGIAIICGGIFLIALS